MKLQMRVSRSGLELVKRFEGLRRRAARLPRGGWTIGYGHTLSAREGAEVGPQDAEALLLYDLNRAAEVVDEVVFTPVNQNQFDALVAFAFNIGVENFRGSAVLKRLNEGCYLKAAAALELWRKADFDGESLVVDALIRRRAAEKALFLTPPEGFRPVPTPVVRPTLDIALMSQMEPVVLDVPMDGDVAKVVFDPAAQEPPMAEASVVTAKLHQLFPDAVVALALVPEAEDEHELDPEDEPIAEAEVDPSQAELDLVSLPPFASEPAPAAPEILSEAEPMLAAAPSGHRFFEPPPRRFPRHRKGIGQDVVQRRAVGELGLELGGLAAQAVVVQRLDDRFQRVDLLDDRADLLQFTVILGAKGLGDPLLPHRFFRVQFGRPSRRAVA